MLYTNHYILFIELTITYVNKQEAKNLLIGIKISDGMSYSISWKTENKG